MRPVTRFIVFPALIRNEPKNSKIKSNIKRNFFAHAGLSYDTLKLRVDNSGSIRCKYDDNKLNEIMSWIDSINR